MSVVGYFAVIVDRSKSCITTSDFLSKLMGLKVTIWRFGIVEDVIKSPLTVLRQWPCSRTLGMHSVLGKKSW